MVDDIERILTDERIFTRLTRFCAAVMFYPMWRLLMIGDRGRSALYYVIDGEYKS